MNKLNKKVLILVVEDEKVLLDTLTEKLQKEGFEVIKATDGREGLDLAITEHPDLILLDLVMPKVDGATMLSKLRLNEWGAKALILVLTNLSNTSSVISVVEDLHMGPNSKDEYIVKANYSLDNLVARIKEKLNVI